MLEGVAADFLGWLKIHDAFISINLQPEIIGRGGLAYLADRTGLIEIKHRIVLEIAAHGLPDRLGVETLDHAVERGIRLALDDVGAETNSIALSRCNVEMIKIARTLVSQVRVGEPLPPALQSIASLAQTNKLAVVAVGVESAGQVEMLKAAGIPMAQGYYFSRPLSADAFRAYFAYDRED